MGHLNKKIEQLAGELFNNYCVGNPKFLNKKAIKACITQTIFQFVTNKYQQHADTMESYESILTSSIELTNLASQLQYPLLIVRPSLVGEKYGIDLSSHDQDYRMMIDLRKFFVKSPDKKWAYAVIHQRMMEYLLTAPEYSIQLAGDSIIAWNAMQFGTSDFQAAFDMIEGMLERLPEYLIKQQTGQ